MSRGHGIWQRRIMEELYPTEIMPWSGRPYRAPKAITAGRVARWSDFRVYAREGVTRSDVVAVRRAIKRLAEEGEVRAHYCRFMTRPVQLYAATLDWDPRMPSVPPYGGYPEWATRPCGSCRKRHSAMEVDALNCGAL